MKSEADRSINCHIYPSDTLSQTSEIWNIVIEPMTLEIQKLGTDCEYVSMERKKYHKTRMCAHSLHFTFETIDFLALYNLTPCLKDSEPI